MKTSPITIRQPAVKEVQNSALAGDLQGHRVSNVTSGHERTAPYVSQDATKLLQKMTDCYAYSTCAALPVVSVVAGGLMWHVGVRDNNDTLISAGKISIMTGIFLTACAVNAFFAFMVGR